MLALAAWSEQNSHALLQTEISVALPNLQWRGGVETIEPLKCGECAGNGKIFGGQCGYFDETGSREMIVRTICPSCEDSQQGLLSHTMANRVAEFLEPRATTFRRGGTQRFQTSLRLVSFNALGSFRLYRRFILKPTQLSHRCRSHGPAGTVSVNSQGPALPSQRKFAACVEHIA